VSSPPPGRRRRVGSRGVHACAQPRPSLLHRRWSWVQNTELRTPAQSFGVDRAVACRRLRPRRGAEAADDSGSMCRSRGRRRGEGMNDKTRARDPLCRPLSVGPSTLALLRPLPGLWPVLGEGPARALLHSGITGAVWIGTVGFAGVGRPVLTLTSCGAAHGFITLALGGLLAGTGAI